MKKSKLIPPVFNAISERPRLLWPEGARVAVWVVMNVEHFTFGKLGTALQPHLVSQPEIANYGWRDYGNRVGIWRLLELFKDLGIPVTAAVNGEIASLYPKVMKAIRAAGWEVMAHGLNNSTGHSGMERAAEKKLIQKTLELLTHEGEIPAGWLTPGFSVTDNTFELLAELGAKYTADWVNDEQPFWYPCGKRKLLAVPYTIEANDITLFLSRNLSGPAFAEAVWDQFHQLWKEGASTGKVFALGLHPFLVGQPLRLGHLASVLRKIRSTPETWLATGKEIFEWVNKQTK